MNGTLVCEHGSLARKCVHCENAELTVEVEALRAKETRLRELCAVEIRISGEVDAPVLASDILRVLDGEPR